MKALLTSYFGPGRKFPRGGLGKKMPSSEIPNNIVVHLDNSCDDEKSGCIRAKRHAILASIKGKVVHNTLTEMVANETTEEPLLVQATKGQYYGHGGEEEDRTHHG
jgi:hypothetical protein